MEIYHEITQRHLAEKHALRDRHTQERIAWQAANGQRKASQVKRPVGRPKKVPPAPGVEVLPPSDEFRW